jgi:hypothetical protein
MGVLDEPSPHERYPELPSKKRTSRARAQAGDHDGPHRFDLALDPLVAGIDLPLSGRLVQPPLSPGFPLEMLDGIRDVEMLALHPGRFERAVEKPAGGADEGQPPAVLLVARLLADEHRAGMRIAGAEHRLRRVRPERAVLAAPGLFSQFSESFFHSST